MIVTGRKVVWGVVVFAAVTGARVLAQQPGAARGGVPDVDAASIVLADISGDWNSVNNEHQPHRVPGPDVTAGALLVALARLNGAGAQAPSGVWFGTWALDVASSTFGPEGSPYKRGTRRIEPAGAGSVAIVDEQVRVRGGILHFEWTGRFDGVDYPVEGVEIALTAAYRCADDRTCDLVQKIDGEVAATARVTISPDGKVLTIVGSSTAGSRIRLIYDKQ